MSQNVTKKIHNKKSDIDSSLMHIRDITVCVSRRKIKNLNLYIRPPHGEVLVTAPVRTSDVYIYEFLMKKYDWIVQNKEKMDGLDCDDGNFITDNQKEHLKQAIKTYVEKWEPVLGVHCQKWTIRKMKTRWGSCSVSKKSIRINLLLAAKQDLCVEYVVVHELVHLLEASHNHVFKAYLTQYLPDWKEREKMLR